MVRYRRPVLFYCRYVGTRVATRVAARVATRVARVDASLLVAFCWLIAFCWLLVVGALVCFVAMLLLRVFVVEDCGGGLGLGAPAGPGHTWSLRDILGFFWNTDGAGFYLKATRLARES